MGFLKRNIIKLVLIVFVVFLALPFIYSNEEEGEFSPFAIKSGLSYHTNPISKLANRIASFYGLPKSNLQTTSERLNINKGDKILGHKTVNTKQTQKSEADTVNQEQETKAASFNKSAALNYNSGYEKYFDTNSKQNIYLEEENNTNINITNNINTTVKEPRAAAKSKARHNVERDHSIYGSSWGSAPATSATGIDYNDYIYNKPSNVPVEEYIQIDDEKFKVVQDITGKKYVATAKGHIPYDVMLRNTVSEKEFLAAKKQLVNATDSQIIQYVLEQKQAAFVAQNRNSNYKGGALTTVGGRAQANKSIQTDIGLNDKMVQEVYEGLRSYNAKGGNIDTSVSVSSSGGANAVINHGDTVIAGVNISNMDRNISGRVQNSYAATQALNKDAEKEFGQNYDNDAEISETGEELDIDDDPDSDTDGKKKRKTWLGRWWDEKRKSIIEYQRPYLEKYRATKQERKEKRKQKRADREQASAEEKAEKQALKDNQSPNEQEQKD